MGGLLTLAAAVGAAIYARAAASHTRDANQLAKDHGIRNVRPYLFYEGGKIVFRKVAAGRKARWTYEITNHGATPAIVHIVRSGHAFSDDEPAHYEMSDIDIQTATVIAPGQSKKLSQDLGIVYAGMQTTVWLMSEIRYADSWDNNYITDNQVMCVGFRKFEYKNAERTYRT